MFSLQQVQFCANECERQRSGERSVARMAEALGYAIRFNERYGELMVIGHTFTKGLARIIEPRSDDYRKVPCYFHGYEFAIAPELVDGAMHSLFINMVDNSRMTGAEPPKMTTDEFVKEFLDIHPFQDGNGRTAAILYNLLNGTLGEPQPLPDYYAKPT